MHLGIQWVGQVPQATNLISLLWPFYTFLGKSSLKIVSEIKCSVEWGLQKDADSKFRAVFHSASSL